MKKVSSAATKQRRNISQQKLTIGFDLGDGDIWYWVVDEAGQIRLERAKRIARQECGWKHGDSGHSAGQQNLVP